MSASRTSERRNVVIKGSNTAYWVYSSSNQSPSEAAIPVILVHGFRGDHHGLELIASTVNSVCVIVPDLPGFGASSYFSDPGDESSILTTLGEWLHEFIGAVAQGPFVLVGHSFGTLVVSAALDAGSQPRETVLINPISSPALKGPNALLSKLALLYYQAARILPNRVGQRLLAHPLIVRVMSEVMAKTRDPELRSWVHDQHDRYFSTFADRDSLLAMFRASISHTVFEYADEFRMPTSIVAADRDDITPIAEQLRLQKTIAKAKLTVVPAVGHLVHYEAPTAASEVINEALVRVAADSG